MASAYTSTGMDYSGFYPAGTPKDTVPGGQFDINNPYSNIESSNVARVTPEGLNVNKVQTVAIDPRTGNPVTVGGHSDSRNANDVVLSRPAPAPVTQRTINAATPLDVNRLGLTVGPSVAPGIQAIDNAAPSGYVPKPWAPIGGFVFPKSTGGLVFDGPNNQPANYSGGDAWGRLRIDGNSPAVSRPGLVTGPIMAATAVRPQTAPAMPIMASANPGQAFLEARGVSTQGLTIGQQANELNKQMSGSSRNADGSRGFM